MKSITSFLLAAIALLVLPACTSTSTVETKTAVSNAVSIATPLIRGGARIAVPMVLAKNPQILDELATINTVAGTVLAVNAPTAEGFSAAIRTAFPEIEQAQALQIGAALQSAYEAAAAMYKAQTGRDLSFTALILDPEYKTDADLLVAALVNGVSEGIADYRSAR